MKGGRLPGEIGTMDDPFRSCMCVIVSVFVLLPDNSSLLKPRSMGSNQSPRLNLKPVQDYRGVNELIWKFWSSRYDGGPVLRRAEVDIYSTPIVGKYLCNYCDNYPFYGKTGITTVLFLPLSN